MTEERRPQHMRESDVFCLRCNGNAHILANLDAGRVVEMTLPAKCIWPSKCPHILHEQVFDRQFGSRLVGTPEDWPGG